jgi:hypothetical protein
LSEFHYVRTCGDDGGVDVCDGTAIGLDLESVLQDGLPPWSVALEMVAGLCEILDIAEEDGEVHGDLTPKFAFIDETGALSLEGFGVSRTRVRAPEGSPKGGVTDLYGLGIIAYSLFCSHSLPALPDDDPDAHDDAIIDAVLLIDLAGVPEEMQGDIQWFVAKLMSFDREDRPSAVEAWRTFIAFANATDGPDFATWCEASLDGGGERRKEAAPAGADGDTTGEEDEDLGGPVMQTGPLAKGAINFGDGGAAGGQATAFWSRDAMKAALDVAPEEDDEDSRRPAAGGGAATAFWSKDQMQAMISGTSEAPRPKRAAGEGDRRKRAKEKTGSGGAPPSREAPAQQRPAAPPPPPKPAPAPAPAPAKPPAAAPIAGPTAAAPPPVAYQAPPVAAPPPQQGGNTGLLVAGAIIVLLVVVLGITFVLGGGGLWFFMQDEPATVEAPAPTEAPGPAPASGGDTDEPDKPAEEADTPKPKPKPTTSPKPKPKPSTTSPKPRPRPKPKPAPVPEPAPTGGPAKVKFTSTGRGTISCAGTNIPFDGVTSITVEPYQLVATCLITMDGKRGVFQIAGSGSIACNLDGGNVVCNKSSVP